MFETLYRYIEDYSSMALTDEERRLIHDTFKHKKLRKKQYYLQEGDISKYIGFITKGAMRMYSVDHKGHEHIVRFGLENWWMGDYESYNMLTPSKYHIDAVEDSELLIVTNQQVQELSARIPGRCRDDKATGQTQQHSHAKPHTCCN